MPFKDEAKKKAYYREYMKKYRRQTGKTEESFDELYAQLTPEEKQIIDKQLHDFCVPHAKQLGTTVDVEVRKFIKILNMTDLELEALFGPLMKHKTSTKDLIPTELMLNPPPNQ